MSTSTRTCPMCGGGPPFNREDTLPEWIREELALTNPGPFLDSRTGVWNTKPRRLPTRIICEDCNHWMGRVYENPAISGGTITSMLRGIRVVMSSDEQAFIASWIHKTLLMITLHRERASAATLGRLGPELRRLRQEVTPPLRGFVGIASVLSGKKNAGIVGPHPDDFPDYPMLPTKAGGFEAYPLSKPDLEYGSLMLNGLGMITVFALGEQRFDLRNVVEERGFVRRIWPPSRYPVRWPPLASIRIETVGWLPAFITYV